MYRILLLEDDRVLLNSLTALLKKSHYLVDATNKLDSASNLLTVNNYDLLIADRLIGNQDSLDLIDDLRFDHYFLKVLVMSCKKMLNDRLLSLKLADDFLAKPIVASELLLKVKNLLCRSKTMLSQNLICSNFILNESGWVYNHQGQAIVHLPSKEAKILQCLLIHQSQAVSYQTLFNYVWPMTDDYPQQRTLNVYVRRIRLNLGQLANNIHTIRNYGFSLSG